jgi:hypothetical protein
MCISLGSSSFQVACELVQPVARKLPEGDLFSLVDRIQQMLDEATSPPDFMSGATAARYVRRRYDIPLTASGGPPYRRLGSQHVFARDDLDVWAQQRIALAPSVAVPLPRQVNHGNRITEKGRPPADGDRPSISFSPLKEEHQHDDS